MTTFPQAGGEAERRRHGGGSFPAAFPSIPFPVASHHLVAYVCCPSHHRLTRWWRVHFHCWWTFGVDLVNPRCCLDIWVHL